MTEQDYKEEVEHLRETAGAFVNSLQRMKELGISLDVEMHHETDESVMFYANHNETLKDIVIVARKTIDL